MRAGHDQLRRDPEQRVEHGVGDVVAADVADPLVLDRAPPPGGEHARVGEAVDLVDERVAVHGDEPGRAGGGQRARVHERGGVIPGQVGGVRDHVGHLSLASGARRARPRGAAR